MVQKMHLNSENCLFDVVLKLGTALAIYIVKAIKRPMLAALAILNGLLRVKY